MADEKGGGGEDAACGDASGDGGEDAAWLLAARQEERWLRTTAVLTEVAVKVEIQVSRAGSMLRAVAVAIEITVLVIFGGG